MRTAKQLKSLYIKCLMHNNKVDQQKKALKMGVLVVVYPKIYTSFCSFVEERIYKRNTVFDRVCMHFKSSATNPKELEQEIVGSNRMDEAVALVERERKEVRRRILGCFEKYRVELNDLVDGIEKD